MQWRRLHPDDSPEAYENQIMGALSEMAKSPTVDQILDLFPKFWRDEYNGAIRRLVLAGRLVMSKDNKLGRYGD